MKQFLLILFSLSLSAADAPKLTTEQKLAIRELQVRVLVLDSRERDAHEEKARAADQLEKKISELTPTGYTITGDLELVPAKPAAPHEARVRKP